MVHSRLNVMEVPDHVQRCSQNMMLLNIKIHIHGSQLFFKYFSVPQYTRNKFYTV